MPFVTIPLKTNVFKLNKQPKYSPRNSHTNLEPINSNHTYSRNFIYTYNAIIAQEREFPNPLATFSEGSTPTQQQCPFIYNNVADYFHKLSYLIIRTLGYLTFF